MTAWMNSPEHKANILTAAFKEIGVGIVLQAPTAGGIAVSASTFLYGTLRGTAIRSRRA